jgi:hypothetical protein
VRGERQTNPIHELEKACKPLKTVIFGRGGAIRTPDPLRPRERSRFQRFHGFSLTVNVYNKPGNLLSFKTQIPRMEQMGFGHSSGTAKKQGR